MLVAARWIQCAFPMDPILQRNTHCTHLLYHTIRCSRTNWTKSDSRNNYMVNLDLMLSFRELAKVCNGLNT